VWQKNLECGEKTTVQNGYDMADPWDKIAGQAKNRIKTTR